MEAVDIGQEPPRCALCRQGADGWFATAIYVSQYYRGGAPEVIESLISHTVAPLQHRLVPIALVRCTLLVMSLRSAYGSRSSGLFHRHGRGMLARWKGSLDSQRNLFVVSLVWQPNQLQNVNHCET